MWADISEYKDSFSVDPMWAKIGAFEHRGLYLTSGTLIRTFSILRIELRISNLCITVALQDAFDKHPEVEWIWCLDADAILMNSELGLWDHLLSPEAMLREVKPEAEIKFGGDKKLPLHKTPIKTSKAIIPENIFIIVSTDFNGIK
jgi:hypothetical protein